MRDVQEAATPIPARARQMLKGIFVSQNPLARFEITQRAIPQTQRSLAPLSISGIVDASSLDISHSTRHDEEHSYCKATREQSYTRAYSPVRRWEPR